MKKIYTVLLFGIALASCDSSKEKMITKKWQAVTLDNPAMNQMVEEQKVFLDTFGKNPDPAVNLANYGVSNMDSMRESLKQQLNDYLAMQEHSVKNTWFDFRKNGVALMNFSGQVDSANWYFNDEGALILDEMKLKGAGNKLVMQVVALEETVLKLKFTEDGMTSTVTFHPDEK